MAILGAQDLNDVIKAGAGYAWLRDIKGLYTNNGYNVVDIKVNGVSVGAGPQLDPNFKFLYRDALSKGATVVYGNGSTYEEKSTSSFPQYDFGKGDAPKETSVVDTPSLAVMRSKAAFTFTPNSNPGVSVEYEKGASATTAVTNGTSTTTGSSSSYTVSFGTSLIGDVGVEFSQAWEQSSTVDFSVTNEKTKSTMQKTTFSFPDLNYIQPNPTDGKYYYGATPEEKAKDPTLVSIELVPGAEYRGAIFVDKHQITGTIDGSSSIIGPRDIPATTYYGATNISFENALKYGSKLYGLGDLSQGVPLTARVDGSVALMASFNVEKATPSKALLLAAVDQTDFANENATSNSVLINLDQISKKYGGAGVDLDLVNESLFAGKSIQIKGGDLTNYVALGDLDHTLATFKNSYIESGNGFNNVVIKEGETANTFRLGGGGDTVTLDGHDNFVNAGEGANVFIIKGKGTNYLATGQGSDVLKFLSKDGLTYVTDFNLNEDRIEFGGDLTTIDAKVVYNSATQAYSVSIGDKEIAYLSVSKDTLPTFDETGAAQGTKIVPIDFSANNKTFVAILYAEAFDRAPDKEGLSFWLQKLDEGLSKTDLVEAVYTNPGFNELYASNRDFVKELYVDLLGRPADAIGEEAAIKFLDSGLSRASIVSSIIHSDEFVQLIGQAAPAPAQ